jgi:hypothetical protein
MFCGRLQDSNSQMLVDRIAPIALCLGNVKQNVMDRCPLTLHNIAKIRSNAKITFGNLMGNLSFFIFEMWKYWGVFRLLAVTFSVTGFLFSIIL